MRFAGKALIGVVILYLFPALLFAQRSKQKPKNLEEVGIEERLGETIPMDLRFQTSEGDSVMLRDLAGNGKPVLLNPVYYDCPMLCSMVIDAVFSGVNELKWTPGKDYTIITFSIDPDETRQLAAETKKQYLEKLDNKPNAGEGWYFLTGDKKEIKQLAESVGFKYEKVEENDQYAHAASIMFLSPEGVITRYLYGIEFGEFNMRNALYEAADGEIGNTIDKVVMYCFQYDPDSNSYVAVAWRIMQLGGLVTMVFLGIFLGFLWLREKNSSNDKNRKT